MDPITFDGLASGMGNYGMMGNMPVTPQQPEGTGFDFLNSGTLGQLGQIGTLGMGLAGAYNAYQQNKLQKKAFNFQRGATNRNIANQATVVNDQLADKGKMQAQMFGNKVGTADYNNYIAKNTKQVNGSAI